ncbi:MAG TPA: hypothetical protein VLJ68_11840, partial [Chitinophagaceae bacterium]|nr:hypothetical protein [Chitinophagaceae bacterium]
KFLRLNPQEKELGIKIKKKEELPDFSEAFSWFKRGSDLDIVLFAGDEINEFRQLNKNFKYAHSFDQKALLLIKGNLPRDVFGRVYTISDFPDIPLRTMKVVFDVTHIHAFYSVLMSRGYLPSTCTEAEFTAKTITHELSHAVNIWHHGELDNEPSPQTFYQNSTPDTHIFDRIGNEIFTRPYTLYGAIGRRGNQESGDLSCVMTYLPVYIWAFRFGSDGSYNFYQVPLIPLGRKLCSSKVGTDFNTPPTNYNARNNYFGNAAVGNCLSQIKLKD